MKPTLDQLSEFHKQIDANRISHFVLQEILDNAPRIAAQRGFRESINAARAAAVKEGDPFLRCKALIRIHEVTNEPSDLAEAQNAAAQATGSDAVMLVIEDHAREGNYGCARSIAKEMAAPERWIAFAKIAQKTKVNRDLKKAQAGLQALQSPVNRDKLLEEIAVAFACLDKNDTSWEIGISISHPLPRAFAFARMYGIRPDKRDEEKLLSDVKVIAAKLTTDDKTLGLSLLARTLADDEKCRLAETVANLITDNATLASTLAYIALRSIYPPDLIRLARAHAHALPRPGDCANKDELYKFGSAWCAVAKASEGRWGMDETADALQKLRKLATSTRDGYDESLLAQVADLNATLGEFEKAMEIAGEISGSLSKRAEAFAAIAKVCSDLLAPKP